MVKIMLIALVAAFAQTVVFAQFGRPEPTKPSPVSPTKVVPTPAAVPAAKAVVEDASNTAKSEAKEAKDAKKEAKNDAKEAKKDAKKEAKNSASAAAISLDDASIEKAVKAKFAALPSLKDNSTLGVSVSGGVATLTGTVKNRGIKGVATNAAKKIAGVKKVNNQIAIDKAK